MGRPRKKLDFQAALSGRGSSTSAGAKAEARGNAVPFGGGVYRPDASVLDELLDEGTADNSHIPPIPGESPDRTLQRECLAALVDGGLRPHDRLKVIQTLDKVNSRIAASAPEQDITAELQAWIRERLGAGPGPMGE